MTLTTLGKRAAPAIVILLLAVGTTFAAGPSAHPSHPTKSPDVTESEAPETEAPETEAPDSEAPETEAPESEAPETEAPESPDATTASDVSAANLDRIVGLLADAGITTTADELKQLADQFGVGGAVRILEFAHDSGKTSADIVAMRQAGDGWGQIRKSLGLTGSSGIGKIMGGHGKGHSKHH
jgi:cytoskeletal protein RodZ